MKIQPRKKAFSGKSRGLDFGPREFIQAKGRKEGTIMGIAQKDIVSVSKTSTIKQAADKMSSYTVRRVFILDAKKRPEGMVSATDIVSFLGGGEFYKIVQNKHGGVLEAAANEPVRLLMAEKPHVIKSTESIQGALLKMFSQDVGSLPIIENGKMVGVVTERDFVSLISKYFSRTKVSELMSGNVIVGTAGMTLEDIAKVMIRNGYRRLPIVQQGALVGVVSTIDLVHEFSKNPKSEILEKRVSKIMNKPLTIGAEDLISDAAEKMRQNSIGGLTVVSEKAKILGVITEKDLLKIVMKQG